MKSRVVAVGFGALSLLGVAACGSDAGTGAAPATTIKIGTPSYQTLLPQVASTVPAQTIVNQPGATVPGSQAYTVKGGDIIVRIAKTYCTTAQAIADFNQWQDGYNHFISPGDVVNIPPGSCAPGTATTNAPTAATNAPTAPPAPTTPQATTTTFDTSAGGTYTVQKGDYLGGIAAKTGTTVDAIVAANGWTDGDKHLLIPGKAIKMPAPAGG